MNTSLRRPATSRSLPHLTTGGVLLVLLSACDLSQPTIPISAEATGAQANELTEPIPLGSSGIQIPNTNGWDQTGATYWQSTPFTVEGWVHIEVSGGVSYTANPDCYYGGFPCSAPLHGATTGPLYSGGSSLIHVGHQSVDAPPATGTGGLNRYLFHPVHGDHQTATAAYTLREHTTPQTIWVRREITYGGSWNPVLAVHDGFQYFLGGSQTITATLVPKPLKVQAPEHVAPGAKGVFRADLGRYQLRRPEGTGPGNFTLIYWMYYPNDTLPNQPSGSYQWVYGCEDKLECEYAPQWPGRMEAHAYVEGQYVKDRGGITKLSPLAVSVSCTPGTVVRAATVQCDATWTPVSIAADDIQFAWRFQGDSVRVFPAADAEAFPPPPPVDSSAVGLRTWSGPAVLSGKVTVTANYTPTGGTGSSQTQTSTDSARFGVASRTGSAFGDLPVTFAPGIVDIATDSTLPLASQPPPNGIGAQGVVGQNYDTFTGQGAMEHVIRGTPQFARVAAGPNAGYWYVSQPAVVSTRGVRMRTWLTGRESPKFRYNPIVAPLLTNRGLLEARRTNDNNANAPRRHRDSTALSNGVLAHETYGSGTTKGHQGQIEVAAKSLPTCGRVPAILERVVAGDTADAGEISTHVLNEGRKSLYAAAWHNFVHSNYTNAPYYEVVAAVTGAKGLGWMIAAGDSVQLAHPQLAPSPRFKCTRTY